MSTANTVEPRRKSRWVRFAMSPDNRPLYVQSRDLRPWVRFATLVHERPRKLLSLGARSGRSFHHGNQAGTLFNRAMAWGLSDTRAVGRGSPDDALLTNRKSPCGRPAGLFFVISVSFCSTLVLH